MDESFGNHCHACFHLLLATSIGMGPPRSLRSHDCSSYKTKDVSDIFLCFWLVNKMRKAIIYNSSMLGDLKLLTRSPSQRQRKPRC